MGRFTGKSIVILGGSAGIGLSAAEIFCREGGQVAITGRNAGALPLIGQRLSVASYISDIADVDATRSVIEAIAHRQLGIDCLIVNAGVGGFAMVPDISEAFWDGIHAVNLRGAFFAIQSALPHVREGGSIVITGSIGADAAVAGNAAYAAAKAGLRAVARIVGKELLPRRIRVNMVSPGPTDTEIFKRDASEQEVEDMRAMLSSVVPMGRMAHPEEVASAIAFLASDEASFINGVDLQVDGGCLAL